MRALLHRLVLPAILLLGSPALAMAQASQWGVAASVTPAWQAGSPFAKIFGSSVDVEGSDFTIGLTRGRALSGDWGVSFVRQSWRDDSSVSDTASDCESFANGCFQFGELYRTRAVQLTGVLVHKFIPFATVKRRVQIGLNIAAGVGRTRGTVEKHEFSVDYLAFDPATSRAIGRQTEAVTTLPMAEETLSVFPLGKVQAAVAVLVVPGLKIRAAGGLDFPGTSVIGITAIYLFGTR